MRYHHIGPIVSALMYHDDLLDAFFNAPNAGAALAAITSEWTEGGAKVEDEVARSLSDLVANFREEPCICSGKYSVSSWFKGAETPLKAIQTVFEYSQADHKWLADILEKHLKNLDRTATLDKLVSLHCTASCLSQTTQDRNAAQAQLCAAAEKCANLACIWAGYSGRLAGLLDEAYHDRPGFNGYRYRLEACGAEWGELAIQFSDLGASLRKYINQQPGTESPAVEGPEETAAQSSASAAKEAQPEPPTEKKKAEPESAAGKNKKESGDDAETRTCQCFRSRKPAEPSSAPNRSSAEATTGWPMGVEPKGLVPPNYMSSNRSLPKLAPPDHPAPDLLERLAQAIASARPRRACVDPICDLRK